MPRNPPWSHDETLMALALYLLLPTSKVDDENEDVIALARKIGRTPGAVALKIFNIKSLDPQYPGKAMSHHSKMDERVWAEYEKDVEGVTNLALRLLIEAHDVPITTVEYNGAELPVGRERETIMRTRANQNHFRNLMLSNFDGKCCITGLSQEQLLVASHIKPWRDADPATERLSPENGLLLNALHDRAFDQGLITIDHELRIVVSHTVPRTPVETNHLWKYEGIRISTPGLYKPGKDFIEYHNDVVFRG